MIGDANPKWIYVNCCLYMCLVCISFFVIVMPLIYLLTSLKHPLKSKPKTIRSIAISSNIVIFSL